MDVCIVVLAKLEEKTKGFAPATILSVAMMLDWLGRRHHRGSGANLALYNRARQADAAASMMESTSMPTALYRSGRSDDCP